MKLSSLLCLFSLTAFSAQATTISRNLFVEFKDKGFHSHINLRVTTSATSEDGESLKISGYTDLQGNVYTVLNKADYDPTLKRLSNAFTILKQEPQSDKIEKIAELSTSCLLRNQNTCRSQVESDLVSIEVESAKPELKKNPIDSGSIVDLTLGLRKHLGYKDEPDSADAKVLEELNLSTAIINKKEILVYSDTETGTFMTVKPEIDSSGNLGLSFLGKDGLIYLATRPGVRTVLETTINVPAYKHNLTTRLEVEAVYGPEVEAVVQPEMGSTLAVLEQSVSGITRKLNYDTGLRFDADSLKPDPQQPNYVEGKGILVQKEETRSGTPTSVETYWDIEGLASHDATSRSVRTQVYRVLNADSERVIKIRSRSGQRVRLVLADSPDFGAQDLSMLEYDFILKSSPGSEPENTDPFKPAETDPFKPGLQ